MIDSLQVLFSLGYVFVLLFLSWGLGRVFVRLVGGSDRQACVNLGNKLFIGLIIQASAAAIFYTKGATLLLAVIPLLFIYVRILCKNPPPIAEDQPGKVPDIILIGIYGLAAWIFFAQVYLIPGNGSVTYQSGDVLYYGRLADYLMKVGIENNNLDFVFPNRFGPTLYHYGDIWIIALCSTYFRINTLIGTNLIAFPVMATLLMVGINDYARQLFKDKVTKFWYIVIPMCMLIVSGFKMMFPSFIINADVYADNVGNYPKVLLCSTLIVFTLQSLRRRSLTTAFILIALIAVLFINVFPPAIMMGGLIILLYWVHKRKAIDYRTIAGCIILVAIVVTYIFIFYHRNEKIVNTENSIAVNQQTLRISINIALGAVLQYSVLIPYLILLIFIIPLSGLKSLYQQIRMQLGNYDLIYIILLPVTGIVMWALLYQTTPDAVQFFHNAFLGANMVVICLLFFASVGSKKIAAKAMVLVLIAVNLAFNYSYHFARTSISNSDYAAAKKVFAHSPGPVSIADLRSAKAFNSIFNINTLVFIPVNFLAYMQPNLKVVSLNTTAIDPAGFKPYEEYAKGILTIQPYNHYLALSKEREDSVSILKFVAQYKFTHVSIAPDTTLPSVLAGLVVDSTVFSNNYKLYSLKPKAI